MMLGLGRIGPVCLQIPLAIAVISTTGREFFWLASNHDSLGALELHSNSCILLTGLSATAYRAVGPTTDTVLYRPMKELSVVQYWSICNRDELHG